MADPGLPSPDTFSFILTLIEKFGILPMAAILWVLWKVGWIGNKSETKKDTVADSGDGKWREDVSERLRSVERQQWEMMRILIVPAVRQPTHHYMDYLLDKLALNRPMRQDELEDLHDLLTQRLQEPEPSGRPGYHMKIRLTMSLVHEQLQAVRQEARQMQGLRQEAAHQCAEEPKGWGGMLRRWLPWQR